MSKILMILDNGFKPDLRVQKEICTLISLGHNVDLYCWDQEGGLPGEERKNYFNIFRICLIVKRQQGLKKIFSLFTFYRNVFKRIEQQKEKYDFIYVHDFLLLFLGVLLKYKLKRPVIYDAHEIYHFMEWEKYPAPVLTLIFWLEKNLIKLTDHFIVVSEHRKNFYAKYVKKKINVIGNWYDEYNGERKDLRSLFSLNKGDTILGYFGTINFTARPINKIIDLIQSTDNFHFFIGGSGADEAKLIDYIKDKRNVHFLGWIENVRQYFDSLDYVVYIMNRERKYFEYTAPNTIYLAISHKKPFITNITGEPLELIQKYNIGYFIKELDSASLEAVCKEKEYDAIIKNIDQIKEQFIWSHSKKIYNNIFNNGKSD